jgi:hypothetical protein
MEQTQQNNGEPLEPQQVVAKAALLAECDRSAAAGVTFVAVHFDGYGDDGTTEEVKCYDGESYAWASTNPLSTMLRTCRNASKISCPSDTRTTAAALGDVVLDVAARKVTVERNDRFEDYTTTTYEVWLYGPYTQTRTKQREEVRWETGRLSSDSQLV